MNAPVRLASLTPGYRALVLGGSGGIGAALVAALAADPQCGAVFTAARGPHAPPPGATPLRFDLLDEDSIAAAVAAAVAAGPLDLVICATGFLHGAGQQPEKTWRALDGAALARAFAINATGPALVARHALEHLRPGAKTVFAALSARVGSISDNRLGGWHAYRASKAALNMLVRTLAVELARRRPQAVALTLHPGTVETALSAPFPPTPGAPPRLSPAASAAALLAVIDQAGPAQSGSLIAWDGAPIPF